MIKGKGRLVRSNADPSFWDFIDKTGDPWLCTFCRHKFAVSTTISRIKWHFSREEGHGTAICTKVPDDIQEAALMAANQGSRKKSKIMPSSSKGISEQSNQVECMNDVGFDSANEEMNALPETIPQGPTLARGSMPVDVQSVEQGVAELAACSGEGIDGHMGPIFPESADEALGMRMHPTIDGNETQNRNPTEDVGRMPNDTEDWLDLFNTLYLDSANVVMDVLSERIPQVGGNTGAGNDTQNIVNKGPTLDEGSMPMVVQSVEQGFAGPTTSLGEGIDGGMEPIIYHSRPELEHDALDNLMHPRMDGNETQNRNPTNGGSMPMNVQSVQLEETAGGQLDDRSLQNLLGSRDSRFAQTFPDIYQEMRYLFVESDEEGDERENMNEEVFVLDGCVSGGEAFVTTKLVGKGFKRNIDEILSLLANDGISTIGVYGMGGAGKTTLMMHVHNLLLTRSNFECVVWVTVSQDFNVHKLQRHIADAIGLHLSNELEEKRRAAKLCEALRNEKRKIVIILDDVWNHFRLEDVGIPIGLHKLILTTRILDVCRRMGFQRKIRVTRLSGEEAWFLFKEKLGNDHLELPDNVKTIAKSIVKECAGLPLGLIAMAGSMREVEDVCEWRNALVELRESRDREDDMGPEVIQVLKVSYTRLKDLALQRCFLYCALFPEDAWINREELIGYLIDEGIIDGMKSRGEEFDKGHAILNKLESACLLEKRPGEVKMHDLLRDMALQIQKGSSGAMVEPGAGLKKFPNVERWKEDLTRVSLMQNNFKVIPSSYSPRCPTLSTLLLCRNIEFRNIGDLFFVQLHGLKILDVSWTLISNLPDAISNLDSLTTLLLHHNFALQYVPSLRKLTRLKKLDISHTGIKEVPQGMELLHNLKYLDLYGSQIISFPTGLLSKLLHLQVLGFMWPTVELRCLRELEMLTCHFHNISEFNRFYLRSQRPGEELSSMDLPSWYKFVIGKSCSDGAIRFEKKVVLKQWCINQQESLLELPIDVQKIEIHECSDVRSLEDIPSLKHATKLKFLNVSSCPKMEYLVLWVSFFSGSLDSLEELHLSLSHKLLSLINIEGPLPCNGTFSCLKIFKVSYCDSMQMLLRGSWLQNLQNLERMEVWACKRLKKIIGMEEGSTSSAATTNTIAPSLPKLRVLVFRDLWALTSICDETLMCSSLQEIRIVDCKELKRVTLSLPLPSLDSILAYPRRWWESVEWGDPAAKNDLRPKCMFRHDRRGTWWWDWDRRS